MVYYQYLNISNHSYISDVKYPPKIIKNVTSGVFYMYYIYVLSPGARFGNMINVIIL